MLWTHDPLDERAPADAFTATIRVSPSPGGKKSQPVWLEREDGERWLAAYQPDPCWRALDGQTMRVEGRRYEPALQSMSVVHFRVAALSCPDPTPAAAFVDVGPERTFTGVVTLASGAPGSKSAGATWTVLAPADGAPLQIYNPSALRAAPGETVTVVGRQVALSPFVARRGGHWICVLRVHPVAGGEG